MTQGAVVAIVFALWAVTRLILHFLFANDVSAQRTTEKGTE